VNASRRRRLIAPPRLRTLAAVAVTTPDALSDPGTSAGFAASYVAVRTGVEPLVLEAVLLAVLVAQVAFETAQPPRSKK
jgi:hypothetical protein